MVRIIVLIFVILLIPLVAAQESVQPCIIDNSDSNMEGVAKGGSIEIPIGCAVDLYFEDVVVVIFKEEEKQIEGTRRLSRVINVSGTGVIEGDRASDSDKRYGIEDTSTISTFTGYMRLCGGVDYYVENLHDLDNPVGWEQVEGAGPVSFSVFSEYSNPGNMISTTSRCMMIGKISDWGELKVGDLRDGGQIVLEDDSILLGGTSIVFTTEGIECISCNYGVIAEPDIQIFGDRFYNDAANSGFESDSYITIGEEKHLISGPVKFEDGQMYVPKGSVAMVDGVYINTVDADADVAVLFDSGDNNPDNYVLLGEGFMKAEGEGFKVALGTGDGGRPNADFPFEMTSDSGYISDDLDNARLILELDADASIFLNVDENYIRRLGGEMAVVNGMNRFNFQGEDPTEFFYQLENCDEDAIAEVSFDGLCDPTSYKLLSSVINFYDPVIEEKIDLHGVGGFILNTNKLYVADDGLVFYRDNWWLLSSETRTVEPLNDLTGELYELDTLHPERIVNQIGEEYNIPSGSVVTAPKGMYVSLSSELEDVEDIDSSNAELYDVYISEESTEFALLENSLVNLVLNRREISSEYLIPISVY
ncbi:hypothetical protein HOD38_05805 [archaeon]|jgi:hypothetical protein|nr:hypothetical protein [archaeon]MBT4397752.1 hypothetical protein [archaeon]MBT4441227.1 hypothetical protein [archaeon]